ncbi:MAG: DUF547 domain-containing protein [Thermodesulfobacteriota bacterium]
MFRLLMLLTFAAFIVFTNNSLSSDYDHEYSDLSGYLSKNVNNGMVDYKKIKANPEGIINLLDLASKVTKDDFNTWDNKQKLTFLINLYNTQTIKLIIDNYPLKSIKDIGNPWDLKVVELFGEKVSLNYLENDVIRKNFHEPRIHFALVCAAKGCPELISESYKTSILDKQLESGVKTFFTKSTINRLDLAASTIYLSHIFEWYGNDFKNKSGSVKKYVLPYLTKKELSEGEIESLKISYTDYDWSLNEKI